MEKIENLQDLAVYLKDNLDKEALFSLEKPKNSPSAFKNFQMGFESGYANAYANLLCLLDEDFKNAYMAQNAGGPNEG